MTPSTTPLARLEQIGFRFVGTWTHDTDCLRRMTRFPWQLAVFALGCTSERSADARPATVAVAACPVPTVDTTGWVAVRTTDHALTARASSAFVKAGQTNQWFTGKRSEDARRSFTLARIVEPWPLDQRGLPTLSATWVPAGDTANRWIDLEYVSSHTACRESIGGVAALVEAGLLTGGSAGSEYRRAVFVMWYSDSGPVAMMTGQASDAAGQAELLAIARTVRFNR